MKPVVLALVIVATGCTAFDTLSHAQERPPGDVARQEAADLADIMSITQFRHLKLGYAGQVANWPLARYEMTLMRQSFSIAVHAYPKVGRVDFAELVKSKSTPALDEIERTIAARNSQGFALAFQKLTEACNSCHRAAGFGFVVMRVPTLSPFSNQVFSPAN